jgi:hypothetical protein
MNGGENLDGLEHVERELRQRVIDELARPTHIAVMENPEWARPARSMPSSASMGR